MHVIQSKFTKTNPQKISNGGAHRSGSTFDMDRPIDDVDTSEGIEVDIVPGGFGMSYHKHACISIVGENHV